MDFSSLSDEAKRELARYLRLNEKARAENTLAFWEPWVCKHNGEHPSQFEAFRSQARRRLVCGGNRSGKTFLGAADTAHMFLGTHPYRENRVPCTLKVIGEDFPNHLNNVIIPQILYFLPKHAVKKVIKHQTYIQKIIGFNDSVIDFMCYEQDKSKFESFAADGVWFDEPPPIEVYQGVIRGLIDRHGYELFTMTPIKQPWIYNELWLPAVSGKLNNTEIFTLMTECNPYLKDHAIAEIKAMYSDDVQAARLRGEFSHLSGLIYRAFKQRSHIIPYFEWPRDWPVYMCIDPHPKKDHAVTWMGVTDKEQKVIIDELKAGVSISDLAKMIMSKEAKMKYRVVDRLIDTSIKSLDRIDQQDILSEHGLRCRYAKKHDDLFPGIQRVQQMLTPVPTKDGVEYIDLVVRDNCRGHIAEFLSYVWDDSQVHRPNKYNDDYMDNVRYITGVDPRFHYNRDGFTYAHVPATYVGHRRVNG